jgi:hypothetical protein
MMKPLGLIRTLALLAACHAATGTEGTGESPPPAPPFDVFAYDCSQLAKLPPEQALEQLDKVREFHSLAISYGSKEQVERNRARNPDLPEQAVRWAALNPALPGYFENRLKELPITYENRAKRSWILADLSTFPAEWALRLMIRAGLTEGEVVTSSEFDLTDKDTLLWFMSRDDGYDPRQLTNRVFANGALRWMKLPGVEEHAQGVWLPKWLAEQDQPTIERLLRGKWGVWTVLNSELGLGPDNRPLPPPPAPAADVARTPDAPGGIAAPLGIQPPLPGPPPIGTPRSRPLPSAGFWLPALAAVSALLAGVFVWRLRKGRAG